MTRAKKKSADGLGAALVRRRFNRSINTKAAPSLSAHVALAGDGKAPLTSIVDQSDLDDLLFTAELAGREFTAQRGTAEIIYLDGAADPSVASSSHGQLGGPAGASPAGIESEREAQERLHRQHLTVPRRPPWSPSQTPQQLDASERAAFLQWRRSLAA